MNRVIEKCEAYKQKTVAAAMKKAQTQYDEACGSFNDTGYDRYYNKMMKLEKEISELEEYLKRDNAIQAAIIEREKTKKELTDIKKKLKNKMFYLMAAIPECSEGRSIQEYLETL